MKHRNKILVIEDDQDILFALTALLDLYDYDSAGIPFVDDVKSIIRIHQPDLVLTDYVLPGMNGGLICKTIKENPVTATHPGDFDDSIPQTGDSAGEFRL